jgi:3-hydroxyisobutyrate dehydrogenase-like beta-hydroxyacid dehydrogenase
MGARVGAELVRAGHRVVWMSKGRSPATAQRAEEAGLSDVHDLDGVVDCESIISICPPAAARDVARQVAETGYSGTYVDANAVSPGTAAAIAATIDQGGGSYVDGGIVGGPPSSRQGPRLYLSGQDSAAIASLFSETTVEAQILAGQGFGASAMKMAYAAWTKGSAALLLAVAEVAERSGLGEVLAAEWDRSQPDLRARLAGATADAEAKAWRWTGEMEEVADTFGELGLPRGFHEGAARIFADSSPAS